MKFPCCCMLGVTAVLTGNGPAQAAEDSSRDPSFYIQSWTSEQGLPANRIDALAQTWDGYLWVGTRFGLVRFDGVRFVTYNRATVPAMVDEAVSALAVDRVDGTLWIGTRAGLMRWQAGQFLPAPHTNRIVLSNTSRLLAAQGGGVWVVSHQRFGFCSATRCDSIKLPVEPGVQARSIAESSDGTLAVMTGRQVFRVHKDGSLAQARLPFEPPTNHTWTTTWAQNGPTRLWLTTQGAIFRQESGQWETLRVLPDRSFPTDYFLEERSGTMWAAVSSVGLFRWTGQDLRAMPLGTRGAEKSITCLLEDREGQIWVGTGRGLFQVRPRLLRVYAVEDGLPHHECLAVCEAPDGSVWTQTKIGPTRIDGNRVTAYPHEPSHHPGECLLVGQDEWVWMGGNPHNGLIAWRPGRETNHLWRQAGGGSGVGISALYSDRSGRVWVGTSRGPVWLEKQQPAISFGEHGLPTNSVRVIYQTRDGAMWFGMNGDGMVRWKPPAPTRPGFGLLAPGNTMALKADLHRYTTRDGLADDRVFAFHESSDGTLWIGTHNGLSRFKDGRFFTFRTEQGLFFNLINWLEEDEFGRFWFSCNRGIFRIDRAELDHAADGRTPRVHPAVYGVADGMLNPETNGEHQPAGCKTRDGRIWFPTMDGVVVIDPQQARRTEAAPLPSIEGAWADQAPLINGSRLGPGRAHDLQFHFTAAALRDPQRTRFQYRLVGRDPGWREETTERRAVYTNLRPGVYRFEVRAANAQSDWNESPAAVSFSLAPYFSQTWPFYALCGTAVTLAVVAFTVYRLRWQHRLLSLRHGQALAEERARIARDLHDDLGTALTGVALELEVARLQASDGMAQRLSESTVHIRTLAGRMREVVWSVDPRCDTVSSLASFLEQQTASLLHAGGLRGRFEFPDDIPALPLGSSARHQLALSVREALTNVLRHAQASEVTLALELASQTLVIRITDNGHGFNPAAGADGRLGRGLENVRQRLASIGGVARIHSAPGHGTNIELRVPLAETPAPGDPP